MTKLSFLMTLHDKLSGLPQSDVEERLRFYSEMIEDRIEEGLTEEEAVAAVGSVEDIAAQIISDISPAPATAKPVKSKQNRKVWEIVLLILGFPVWFPLLIAGAAVAFSLYVSLWAVIISLWAVFASLVACAFAGILTGIVFTFGINKHAGIAMIGAGILCTGLAILLFIGCNALTKGTLSLTKRFPGYMKNCFVKKEDASCI